MDRLYSINSPNGKLYNTSNFDYNKTSEGYLLKVINIEDSIWDVYIKETKPGICNRCNKYLSKEKDKSDKIKYKLLCPNESLFIYSQRRGNEYYYIYKHYCSSCLNKALYMWSIKNEHNKYPQLRVDGFSFIYNLENINDDDDIPKKNYPRIYNCDYYLSQGYNYLDDESKKYTDNELIMKKKIINQEMLDIY